MTASYKPRLKQLYTDEVIAALTEQFGYSNIMCVPKLTKIVLNSTTKDAVTNRKVLDSIVEELTLISGQKAVLVKARKSIANFKLRDGMAIGARVTLRGTQMWEFFDRLVSVAIPQLRDFRGLKATSFDGRGNYSLGLTEQIIFPEIEYDRVSRINGMNIAFVTSAENDEEGRALLAKLGMPFKH